MERTITTIAPLETREKVLRTAAYCRVSSNSTDQLHSFAAQMQYYTKAISNNPKMSLVDIYADEGLTGTKTDKRDEFKRLINDCRKGKIDRILTKSVSRFARNTVDSIMYARLLKEHGVSILFEKENIDTEYMSSELLLALFGAQAQEESISISKNMRWSFEKRMKNGTYLSGSVPYGYKLQNCKFVIYEPEAKIVRLIFSSFLSGMGKKAIADMLNKSNTPKRFGFTTWWVSTIDYILSNERYMGDAILQKKYTTDTLPFRVKRNHGEKAQYYVENMYPPIISKETFFAAQRLKSKFPVKKIKEFHTRPLTNKIYCTCSHVYTPVNIRGKQYWECKLHNFDSSLCNSRRISETDIYETFITMVNKLKNCYQDILPPAISMMERLQMKTNGTELKVKEIDKQIIDLNNKLLVFAHLSNKGILRAAEYTEQSNRIKQTVSELRIKKRNLLNEQNGDNVLPSLRNLNTVFDNIAEPLTEFDEELFAEIIQQIVIVPPASLCFKLLGNLTLTENICEQGRCKQQ